MQPSQCAVYARYSSDQQRPTSIDDQLRKCLEYARQQGWVVDPGDIYTDEALSGVGADRVGYRTMLQRVFQKPRRIATILVDDTSRLSRSLPEVVHLQQRLTFEGIRLIAISQGIDSAHEQAEVLFAIHGIVDSLYVKELAKKTHRGLEGLALRGLHTGGRCLGYRTVSADGAFKLVVDPEEAATVRYIFQLYADGLSLKKVARQLTAEGYRPPRTSRSGNIIAWPHTGIREMLRRELYVGVLIWNRRKFIKNHGTNKRVSRLRPESEWIRVQVPALRIVPEALWLQVQQRLRESTNEFDRRNGKQPRLTRSRPNDA